MIRVAHYIRHGEGTKAVRKIFYKVPLDKFEEEKLKEFELAIKQDGTPLPQWWNRGEALRWCYSQRFEIPKCLQVS
jgi:hypothetical protein